MRPPLPWALALLLSASLVQAAEPSANAPKSTKSTRTTSGDSDEADAKSGTFLGRMFGKSPDSPTDTTKTALASGTKAEATKTDAKQEPRTSKRPVAPKDKPAPAPPEAPKTEDERFIFARKTASEDPKVIELRSKADAAIKDAEVARLTRAYLRTLYGKMRTLEPTIKERIDLTEAAALRLVPERAQ